MERRTASAALAIVIALGVGAPAAFAAPANDRRVAAQSEPPELEGTPGPAVVSDGERRGALLAAAVVLGFGAVLAVSMIRGGRLGTRWYYGGTSRTERGGQGRPVDPTNNVRSREW